MTKHENNYLFLDMGNTNTKCYDADLNLIFILSTNEQVHKIVSTLNKYKGFTVYYSKVLNPNCNSIVKGLKKVEAINVRELLERNIDNVKLLAKLGIGEVGTDIILGCLGGITEGFDDFVIVDQGTACTVSVVKNQTLQGVNIYPGWITLANDFERSTGLRVDNIDMLIGKDLTIGQDTNSALVLGIGKMYWDTLEKDIKNMKEKFEITDELNAMQLIKKGFQYIVNADKGE